MAQNERKNELKLSLERGLYLRLSLLNVMGLGELKFYELIREVESSAIYKLLSKPGSGSAPAITRKRFLFAWELNCGARETQPATDSRYAMSDMAGGKEELISAIRGMGRRKFEKYFLEGTATEEEAAAATGLEKEAVKRIREFVDCFLLAGENTLREGPFAESSNLVAALSSERGRPLIEYVSPYYSSGLYEVDGRRMEKLRASPEMKGREKELRKLLLDISRLNFRKNSLDIVLRSLCEYQKEYIYKGGDMRPLSMRKFAEDSGLDVSVVSRAVSKKCVKLPSGETLKIRSFFLSRKVFTMGKISDILKKKKNVSGEELSALLLKGTGLKIPVRTANYYRSLLRRK